MWSVYFFRDPPRGVPQDDSILVAPADGLVQMIAAAVPPAELGLGEAPLIRVSIFLSVFDVHVNRAPCAGTVDVVAYRPGKFLSAAADKASEENERMALALRRPDGRVIGCVQIAGWVARRIVCYVKPGQAVAIGERFGHIRFGSRTDLYLPAGAFAGGGRTAHDRRRELSSPSSIRRRRSRAEPSTRRNCRRPPWTAISAGAASCGASQSTD